MRLNRKERFTLLELMVALGISVTLVASLVLAFLGMKMTSAMARHRMQAMQMVRGQVEFLKATAFANLANSTTNNVAYDAGADGVFGTADDLKGTLTVTLRDFLDMDTDGDTNETSVDINGDGVNDSTYARPVRVSFSWTQYVFGASKTFTVFVDTLIAA